MGLRLPAETLLGHVKESCVISRSRVTYEGVMSLINGSQTSCQDTVSACERIMRPMKESSLIWMGHVTYKWVSNSLPRHCVSMWQSRVSYEGVMSLINGSQTSFQDTVLACERVMYHTKKSSDIQMSAGLSVDTLFHMWKILVSQSQVLLSTHPAERTRVVS